MIKLKNIKLEGITLTDQVRKVGEEHCEFITAIMKNDTDNAVEDFFELMQAGLGALDKMGMDVLKILTMCNHNRK